MSALIMRSHWEMPTAYHRVVISVIFDFIVTCDISFEYRRIYNSTWCHSSQVLCLVAPKCTPYNQIEHSDRIHHISDGQQ